MCMCMHVCVGGVIKFKEKTAVTGLPVYVKSEYIGSSSL